MNTRVEALHMHISNSPTLSSVFRLCVCLLSCIHHTQSSDRGGRGTSTVIDMVSSSIDAAATSDTSRRRGNMRNRVAALNEASSYYEISEEEIKSEVEKCQLQLSVADRDMQRDQREKETSQRLNRVSNAFKSYEDTGVLDSMLVEIQKVIVAFVTASNAHRYDVLETLTRAALGSEEDDEEDEHFHLQSRGAKDKDKDSDKRGDAFKSPKGISTSYVQGLLEEIQRHCFKAELENFMRKEGELMMGRGLTLDDIRVKSDSGGKQKVTGDDDDAEMTAKEKETKRGSFFGLSWLFCQMVGSTADAGKNSFDISQLVLSDKVPPLEVRMRERIIECIEVKHYSGSGNSFREEILVLTNERVYLLKRIAETPFLKEGAEVEKLESGDR